MQGELGQWVAKFEGVGVVGSCGGCREAPPSSPSWCSTLIQWELVLVQWRLELVRWELRLVQWPVYQ